MCGRFTRSGPVREVARLFELAEPPAELAPRYNITPGQKIAVVALLGDGETRMLTEMKWGIESSFGKMKPFNVRADSLLTKPMFSKSFKERRCLVPADGFYEFPDDKSEKRQFHLRLRGGALFAFPAIWRDGTVATVTTEANALTASIPHPRSPVILRPEEYQQWLDPTSDPKELLELLRPYPAEEMELWEVGGLIRSWKNDGPECLDPIT